MTANGQCCPTCGQVMQSPDLHVDLCSNIVAFNGRCAALSPRAAEIVSVLARRPGVMMPYETIIAAVYGALPRACNEFSAIQRQVTRLRQKLAPLGLAVKCHRGEGYSLECGARRLVYKDERASWTEELIERFLSLCKREVPRDRIAEDLGLTIDQVANLHARLKQKGRLPYPLPYRSTTPPQRKYRRWRPAAGPARQMEGV